MVDELLCPDCGGVVGATQATEAGAPCKCFADHARYKSDETAHDFTAPVEAPVEAPVQKICVVCGMDVSGKKRLKDSRGYICYDCAKAEEFRDNGNRVRCRVCGRLVKEETLTMYEGTKMCSKCNAERIALKKEKFKQIGVVAARQRFEFKQVYSLLAVLGVLLSIIAISWLYRVITHHHH